MVGMFLAIYAWMDTHIEPHPTQTTPNSCDKQFGRVEPHRTLARYTLLMLYSSSKRTLLSTLREFDVVRLAPLYSISRVGCGLKKVEEVRKSRTTLNSRKVHFAYAVQ